MSSRIRSLNSVCSCLLLTLGGVEGEKNLTETHTAPEVLSQRQQWEAAGSMTMG